MRKKLHYPVHVAGWAYFFGALVLLTLGSWVQGLDFKAGMLITEYVLVLLPVIVIGLYFKVDMKSALRLKPLKPMEVFLVPLTVIFALPITLFLNMLVVALMAFFGKAYGMPIPSADNLSDLSVLFFIISISAGICEEFFFRGMILDAYTARFSAKKGILISAVLFGMFHFNPQNLLGPIFLGLLFGYMVLITESLLAGILGHMANNGVAVLIMYIANRSKNPALSDGSNADLLNGNPEQLLMALGVIGVFAAGSALAVFGLLSSIAEGRRLKGVDEKTDVIQMKAEDFEGDFDVQLRNRSLRLTEFVPLALPLVMYTAISYMLIVSKH